MELNWHRLFGPFLIDYFTGSPYEVELEKDLSVKKQFLDVVILRKRRGGRMAELPDGLDNLGEHNLLSYKSLREPFDAWAMKELIGHYVNYRKQASPSFKKLIPESRFRLYAVSTRFPRRLGKAVELRGLLRGVYELGWGADTLRLIVLSQIGKGRHNALWRLFSTDPESVLEAQEEYHIHSELSTLVQQLFDHYRKENSAMPYTAQDYQKDYVREHLDMLPPEEVLSRYSPEEKLKGIPSDERLRGISLEDRLKDVSLAELEMLLEKFKGHRAS